MPRLDTVGFGYISYKGSSETLKIPFDVNRHGIFSATVPEWLVPNLTAQLEQCDWSSWDIAVEQPRTHWRVTRSLRSQVSKLIIEALADYSAPTVTSELIIPYTVGTEASVWELPDGRLAANGYVARAIHEKEGRPSKDQGEDGYGEWSSLLTLNATNANDSYRVRAAAVVREKVITKRGAFVQHEYKQPKINRFHGALNDPIWKLNSFCGVRLSKQAKEIPYTPEAAEFFYTLMIGMAELALRIERFFQDETAMLSHIHSGQRLLGVDSDSCDAASR